MGKKEKRYVVESEFDDLHGNPDDMPEFDLDLSDADNPIIAAAADDDDENWQPPENDDDESDEDDKDEDGDIDDDDDDADDDSELEEMDGDDNEDDDSDDDDDGDEDDDDDERYSKRVQRRIDRERNLRLQERQESNQRIAKLERQSELRDAKDEFRTAQAEAETKLRSLKRKKTTAIDEGTTTEVVEIDDQILDIKADMKAKEINLKQVEDSIDDDTGDQTSTNTPEAGRKFLEKYPEFHTNATFRNVLLLTDKAVAARHFDKNTEEYYAEIERILKPQFPKIIRVAKITKKRKKKVVKRKRSAVGGTQKAGTRNASKNSRRRGRIRLTKVDQQQMEVFGLDPTNPADAKAWAQGKGN